MELIKASPRIDILHKNYCKGPVFQEELYYWPLRRQRLIYMREYLNNPKYTTRLRKAYADAEILKQMPVVIEDYELIVGKSDFSALNSDEQEEFDRLEKCMLAEPQGQGLGGHMVLDYPKLLRVGVEGLLEEVREYRSKLDIDFNPEENLSKDEFYEACEVELEGLLTLEKRYAATAREMAESEARPWRKKELLEIAEVLDQVPAKPARTFREALQSLHFYHFSLWNGFHYGRVDQFLWPYYENDIRDGRLTREEAQELIDCFRLICIGYMHPDTAVNVMVGGRDPEGRAVENELTWMFLNSIDHNKSMHKVELAITKETSDDLLRLAIELNAKGYTLPSMLNDDIITEGMIQAGYPVEDARNWADTGCVEITPIGKSGIFVVSPYHNMANMLLEAMEHDVNSTDELFEVFCTILREKIRDGLREQNRYQLERSRNGMECMRVSCLVNDCLKRGRAVDEGGAVYNQIQPNFLGMANVIDSFITLDKLVFKTGEYSLAEFREILKNDFEGHEDLRQRIINRLPHYGVGDREADAYAIRLTEAIKKACEGFKTFRGSTLLPGVFSYLEHARHGLCTGATPDGRKAYYPLSSGSSPVQGREVKGPTAAMLSATSWDHRPFLGGVAVNMKFTPNQMSGESQDKMLTLVKTFMKRGGFQMQVNAVSSETLRAAKANPSAYKDLIVRVGGFSAYFTKLTPEMQQELIDRNEHLV